jgi:HK97 family phage major capsid protein
MPTLSEYQKLANDDVTAGVFDNIITASELAPFLQFSSFSGNSLVYNRENTLGAAATHQVGDIWSDTEPTYTKKTVSLTTVGVQHPLDRFALQTADNVQSQEAVLLSKMAKSIVRKLEDLLISGNSGSTSTEPEGLTSLLISDSRLLMMDDGSQPASITGAETELTLDRLDAMIDLVENGKPDFLMMNKTMRRKMTSLARATGSGVVLTSADMFGHQYVVYNGIPVVINDFVSNSEQYEQGDSQWPSSSATTIYAIKTGQEKQGWTVIHNGSVLDPDIQRLGTKFDKNEDVYRMAVYLNAVVYSAKSCAGLAVIDSAA